MFLPQPIEQDHLLGQASPRESNQWLPLEIWTMKQAHENTHHLTPPAACCHRSAESNLPPSIEGLALPPQIPRRSTTSLWRQMMVAQS
jgi:hypothetical protein